MAETLTDPAISAAAEAAATGVSDAETSGPAGTDAEASERARLKAISEVLRDIARGGTAGIFVGIVVAGLGGRLVMRLATILHEDRVGLVTEMDAVIGAMTLNGTLALLIFGGLGAGLMAAVLWVVVRPWLPGSGLGRAAITGLLAIALGTPLLIRRTNPDFVILDYDPVVVALLLALVFAVGFSMAVVDGWLDRRMPHSVLGDDASAAGYLAITFLGLFLILPLVVAAMISEPYYRAPIRAGWGLAVVGVCTLAWWVLRARGRTEPPRALAVIGGVSLVVTAVLGMLTILPHVRVAMGMA